MRGSERVRAAFRDDRVALIPYLTGGYPTLEGAWEVGEAYVEAGADVLEIGVPFSDPLADGPTTQDTATRALENGADLDYCLELAGGFSGRVPVVLGFGIGSVEAATQAAKEADGVIIGSKLMRLVGEGGPERAGGWLREVREALSDVARVGG